MQWQYLLHILSLFRFKHPGLASFIPFAMVGLSGMGVYAGLLAALDALCSSSMEAWLRILIAIVLTMTWNFVWDRRFAFWDASGSIVRQYAGFVAVCAVPLLVVYVVTWLFSDVTVLPVAGLIGSAVGSAFGLVFNWCGARWLVFRRS